jgi:uncharacterized protein YifN (PemK superfamily)
MLLCDYGKGGFREPEMVKRRPAIAIVSQLPFRSGLCTVVPMSGTEPQRAVPYVVRLDLPEPLPAPFDFKVWWVKCDMIATVGFDRLDLFHTVRGPDHRRKYLDPKLSEADFDRVCQGILNGLGFVNLTYVGKTLS